MASVLPCTALTRVLPHHPIPMIAASTILQLLVPCGSDQTSRNQLERCAPVNIPIGFRRLETTKTGGSAMSYREVSEVRDGMRIDWDVPIPMDDGLVLRADVFRPVEAGQYP